MSKEIDWSKAPEGAVAFFRKRSSRIEHEDFFARSLRRSKILAGPGTCGITIGGEEFHVHFEHWEMIEKPEPIPAWTGEGLPPVGTVCEFAGYAAGDESVNDPKIGDQVTIIAHFKDHDYDLAAYTYRSKDGLVVAQGGYGIFRQIRTPEQIAADERDSVIAEMVSSAIYQSYAITPAQAKIACGRLYDAGYRKCSE